MKNLLQLKWYRIYYNSKSNLNHIELDKDERQVLVDGVEYQLYKGKNFEDSREIELLWMKKVIKPIK